MNRIFEISLVRNDNYPLNVIFDPTKIVVSDSSQVMGEESITSPLKISSDAQNLVLRGYLLVDSQNHWFDIWTWENDGTNTEANQYCRITVDLSQERPKCHFIKYPAGNSLTCQGFNLKIQHSGNNNN